MLESSVWPSIDAFQDIFMGRLIRVLAGYSVNRIQRTSSCLEKLKVRLRVLVMDCMVRGFRTNDSPGGSTDGPLTTGCVEIPYQATIPLWKRHHRQFETKLVRFQVVPFPCLTTASDCKMLQMSSLCHRHRSTKSLFNRSASPMQDQYTPRPSQNHCTRLPASKPAPDMRTCAQIRMRARV